MGPAAGGRVAGAAAAVGRRTFVVAQEARQALTFVVIRVGVVVIVAHEALCWVGAERSGGSSSGSTSSSCLHVLREVDFTRSEPTGISEIFVVLLPLCVVDQLGQVVIVVFRRIISRFLAALLRRHPWSLTA